MADKVQGGTPNGNKSLCQTCSHVHLICGVNFERLTRCSVWGETIDITFPVAECSKYEDKRLPSLYDMEKIAWTVESRKRGKAGFSDPDTNACDVTIAPPVKRRGGSVVPD